MATHTGTEAGRQPIRIYMTLLDAICNPFIVSDQRCERGDQRDDGSSIAKVCCGAT